MVVSVRPSRPWVVLFIIAVVIGLTVFAVLAWRSVDVEQVDVTDAPKRFEEVLANFDSHIPLVKMDASGRFVRRALSGMTGVRPEQLHVLAYSASEQRLLRADVPLWFFKVKGPGVHYALRGTGFDLEALGLTASDLERSGIGVVLDEMRANGDRLLAWTD
jgi:hypothetical protein